MTGEPNRLLLALHGLRLKGFAESKVIADLVGVPEDQIGASLAGAADSGFAIYRDGNRTGWTMTKEGRAENERLLAAELDEAGFRDEVVGHYQAFLTLNPRMLATCTAWQVRDQDAQVMNDHSDPVYDADVIGNLEQIDSEVQPICEALCKLFDRFGNYGPRFNFALDRLRGGDNDWFTKPLIESYHTVWFELHEDLLATLGIDRASEKG